MWQPCEPPLSALVLYGALVWPFVIVGKLGVEDFPQRLGGILQSAVFGFIVDVILAWHLGKWIEKIKKVPSMPFLKRYATQTVILFVAILLIAGALTFLNPHCG